MPNVPVYEVGEIGVIADVPPEELEPRAWSDARNVRFADGKALRPSMDSSVITPPLAPPYQIVSLQAGASAFWTYSSLDKLYITDGVSHADATRVVGGNYSVTKDGLWSGGLASGALVITNGADAPQALSGPSLSAKFIDLPAWPSTDRCVVMKYFKNFLIALNVTVGGGTYQHLVRWSHPAVPGSLPTSWDVADPTKLAGEVEIVDEFPGGIQDGGGLRDTFIIYKDNSVWGMQYVGGNSVFRFFPIFLQTGILSKHCFTEIKDGSLHFLATGDDFIIHDGQTSKSVFTRRMKSFIYNRLPETMRGRCFAISKPMTQEAWFCFPEDGHEWPNLAAIYNWNNDTCTIRELPGQGISFMGLGPLGTSSDPWDEDSGSWDSDTTEWSLSLFSSHFLSLVGCAPNDSKFYHIEDGVTFGDGYIERTGLALMGQDRVTGALKADNEVMKLFDRVWMKAMGGQFKVSLGGQEFIEAPVVYQPSQIFIPGTTKYLDFYPVNARFMAIKIEWDASVQARTSIQGYDVNIKPLGEQ